MLSPANDPALTGGSRAANRPACWALVALAVALVLAAGWVLVGGRDDAVRPAATAATAGGVAAAGPGATNIAAALVAEQAVLPPGGTTSLAIAMTPAPGWHGYWGNGGDAGFGMRVTWTTPPGVTIGPLAYPVPGRLRIAGLMNHVYKAPYAILADVSVPRGLKAGTRVPIAGAAEWLACTDTICVPERGTLRAEVVIGAVGPADRRFDAWRAALPRALDRGGAWSVRDEGGIAVQIPFPATAPAPDPHLFVETGGVVAPAAPQRWSRKGDWLLLEVEAARTFAPPAGALVGLLSTGIDDAGGRAQGVTVRLERAARLPVDGQGAVALVPQPAMTAGEASGVAPFLIALGGAVLGGLILNVMPCVFPILSLKVMAVARGGGVRAEVRREAWGYVLGATGAAAMLGVVLVALRQAGASLGWAFQLQHPASVLLLTALVAAITANLAGLFIWPALGGGGGAARSAGTFRGGLTTGAVAGVIATPCGGPFMAAALGATLTLPTGPALVVFAGLGLGLALPFLALAYSDALRARLPRPGAWMEGMQRWLAVPMALTLAALVWLLWRQAGGTGLAAGAAVSLAVGWAALLAGRVQRRGQRAWPLALMAGIVTVLGAIVLAGRPAATTTAAGDDRASGAAIASGDAPFDPTLLETWQRDGPVFVHFTADWCVTCKVNEAAAINRPEVRRALADAGVRVMVADWTAGDPAITRALAANGRNSVPLYLWYPGGDGEAETLPQVLTPGLLIARAGRGRQP